MQRPQVSTSAAQRAGRLSLTAVVSQVSFSPSTAAADFRAEFLADTKTAGSCVLLAQHQESKAEAQGRDRCSHGSTSRLHEGDKRVFCSKYILQILTIEHFVTQ
eukprot:scaffold406916_cov43-Prasinocladus_malaysianus.AAC.1